MSSRLLAPVPLATMPRSAPPRRARYWLACVWLCVLLVVLAAFALFCLAVPARMVELAVPCRLGACASGQVSVAGASLSSSVEYVGALVGGEVLYALCYLLVAAVIFWRRPRDPVALFVAGMLALWGLTFPPTLSALANTDAQWFWPVAVARFAGAAAITLLFYVFPDGRFRPRVAWALALVWVGAQVPHYFQPGSPLDFALLPPAMLAVVSAGFLGVMVALQLWRYRAVSNVTQRRQTKWVVLGIVCALLGYAALLGVAALVPEMTIPGTAGYVVLTLGEEAAVALLPLCIGVAILRDRLYDIDLLLNRVLVYGSLTVLLTALYFAVVIALQQVAQVVTRQAQDENPLLIVLSTLAIAAAFHPLRVRLQHGIDKRFFRTRYDSALMLAEVARMIRAEVDLATLTDRLVGVVGKAFEPTHVSIWLRPPREASGTGKPKTMRAVNEDE